MPVENRTSPEELEERYETVQSLITRGYNGADVWRYIQEKTDWGISRRMAYNYYNTAFDKLADDSNVNRPAWFTTCLHRLDRQYKKADDKGDYNAAASITVDIIRFLKLDTPNADYDWTQVAKEQGFNPDEIKGRLKRLMTPDDDLSTMVDTTKPERANGQR